MTTLITGAGLVGSLAANRLIADHGERPVLYDVAFSMDNLAERVPVDQVQMVRGDVTDVAELVDAIQQHGVDRILHTAALLTGMVRDRPHAGVKINFNGTHAVLEAARLAGVKRVVFCSSATVYFGLQGPPEGGLLREDQPLRLVSEHPPSIYASMKIAAEWLGDMYRREYGIEFVVVRFGAVYGPWRGTPGGGPTRLVQELVEAAHGGRPVRLKTADLNGGAMDFVYAADCAQAAVRALHATDPRSRVYNVGEGIARKPPEIISALERVLGHPVELDVQDRGISETGYAADTAPLDLTRTRAELGYEVEWPLERALADYLAWLERTRGPRAKAPTPA